MGLPEEIVVGGVRREERLQRSHEHAGRVTGTDDTSPLCEDDAVVRRTRVERPAMRDREVSYVLGDDRPSFRHGQSQEIQVAAPTKVIAFGNCDDVVTPAAKLGSDSRIVMLVE